MYNSTDRLIGIVKDRVNSLLYDDVIQCTIGVMIDLSNALRELSVQITSLSPEQKEQVKDILLPLASEAMREALHKSELPITNGIIKTKNQILTTLGVSIPHDHGEIDSTKYCGYNW